MRVEIEVGHGSPFITSARRLRRRTCQPATGTRTTGEDAATVVGPRLASSNPWWVEGSGQWGPLLPLLRLWTEITRGWQLIVVPFEASPRFSNGYAIRSHVTVVLMPKKLGQAPAGAVDPALDRADLRAADFGSFFVAVTFRSNQQHGLTLLF